MFVCSFFNDDDGNRYFATGESMEEAFENIQHDNAMDIDPECDGIEFFELVTHIYSVRPRFEKI